MADRTQHEGKTERAKESHDRCSQPPGMHVLKTTDLGTQALLVVNSFKLQLTACRKHKTTTIKNYVYYLWIFSWPIYFPLWPNL